MQATPKLAVTLIFRPSIMNGSARTVLPYLAGGGNCRMEVSLWQNNGELLPADTATQSVPRRSPLCTRLPELSQHSISML